MTSISAVITAPDGIAKCLLADDLVAEADGVSLELIVVDGAPDYTDRSRPGLRHLSVPGRDIYGLITAGLARADKDWVFVTEDHAKAEPGLLRTYRAAIDAHPDIDLFSGAVENKTSTSPWSFANFLIGIHQYWPPAGQNPVSACNANLLVRREAIDASELASDGGFMNLTLARLVRSGRHRHCADAIVDHVLPLTLRQGFEFQYHCAAVSTRIRRDTMPPRPALVQIMRDCAGLMYLATIHPWRVMRRLRQTEQFRWGMGARLMLVGFASALGNLSADVGRLAQANRRRKVGSGRQE